MDPVTAAGLAIGVAGVGFQVYTGCVQAIQLLITAKNFPDEFKYLNLRLRMEQQRLFAWSETSGLADVDSKNQQKILKTNTFFLHRTTVLDLLVQVQCLFKEFQDEQKRYQRILVIPDSAESLETPEKDASDANFPLPQRRRDFIQKAMSKLKNLSTEGALRLRWASFDRDGFERLLSKFAVLNDNMTDILDARLQVEIHHTVQDTNRGMLQLHHKIADLSRLVMALNLKLEPPAQQAQSPKSDSQREVRAKEASGLLLLSQLAKFKAFNESIESGRNNALDEKTTSQLELGRPQEQEKLKLDSAMIELKQQGASGSQRCEAIFKAPDGKRKNIWIEWKEFDGHISSDSVPAKQVIVDRVRKLAALLNHSPKPEAFRTPHCLGYFDQEENDDDSSDEEGCSRLGLVFERPEDASIDKESPAVSLRELLECDSKGHPKPSLTARRDLALAVSNCLLSLHLANWLHKSLRSDNVIFFRDIKGQIDYAKPYISGFDFSRPARKDEPTEIASQDDIMHNLYRYPSIQSSQSAQRPRFKKSFDMYSLGVVLQEIGHWAPVEDIVKINIERAWRQPSIIEGVRDILLAEKTREELRGNMGSVYETAIRRCIAGGEFLKLKDGDDETNDKVATTLSMAFYENVVKELERIIV
ncbi:hypothetical protein PFICI_03717 [Pestalotiopsis fici W106-1]|uniref:Protein kinase domain-containing protein n=1 Tax=Pestalotiopsis fici (strain W106-1 / CGMCC3.15140) TaxID=1229662 RepID=W3XJN3_PESFW|nr:uncharacterized protein PFICI_03717 [Pestalotiopsis fici W106-1]ETS85692.1 hypothetical protein PFICI_03717 [Pestalotiopsis fici W106-1]